MAQTRVGELLIKYVRNTLTPGERSELDQEIQRSESTRIMYEELHDKDLAWAELRIFTCPDKDKMWTKISSECIFSDQRNAS